MWAAPLSLNKGEWSFFISYFLDKFNALFDKLAEPTSVRAHGEVVS